MTHERDIERLLDTWFADGPAEVPDRVLDGVAGRIHGRRQLPAWRLDLRLTPMTSFAKPLAALAAVILVAVAAFTVTRPADNAATPNVTPVPVQSTSPASTQSASPAASPVAVSCGDATGCAGPLEAGEHTSAQLAIPLRYTVPDGWTNTMDIPRTYRLVTLGGLAAPIQVLTMLAIADQAACGPVALAGTGSTVQDLVDLVASHPGLVADAPVPVTIDGYQGQVIDFGVRSTWAATCPDIDPILPMVMLLTDTGTPPARAIGYSVESRIRWIVLDVAGETVIIEVVGPPVRSQFDSALAADQPVIDSFDFTPGG